jgi:hypothetical protein
LLIVILLPLELQVQRNKKFTTSAVARLSYMVKRVC